MANLGEYPECQKQVAVADRLVITKLDIADPGLRLPLEAQLAHVNPSAPCLALDALQLDARQLLGVDAFEMASKSDEVAQWLQAPRQRNYLSLGASAAEGANANVHRDIVAFALDLPETVDWTVFSVWLSLLLHAHGAQILRVKGLLNVGGVEAPVVVHGVQQLVHPPSHLERWPTADRTSRLVFIVRGLEPQRVQDSLRHCLHDWA
jgi:G3E family GTPase